MEDTLLDHEHEGEVHIPSDSDDDAGDAHGAARGSDGSDGHSHPRGSGFHRFCLGLRKLWKCACAAAPRRSRAHGGTRPRHAPAQHAPPVDRGWHSHARVCVACRLQPGDHTALLMRQRLCSHGPRVAHVHRVPGPRQPNVGPAERRGERVQVAVGAVVEHRHRAHPAGHGRAPGRRHGQGPVRGVLRAVRQGAAHRAVAVDRDGRAVRRRAGGRGLRHRAEPAGRHAAVGRRAADGAGHVFGAAH